MSKGAHNTSHPRKGGLVGRGGRLMGKLGRLLTLKRLEEGYTRQDLARALSSKARRPALQLRRGHVLAQTEARVGRLYRRLTT